MPRLRVRRLILPLLLLALPLALCSISHNATPPPPGFTILLDGAPKGLDPRFATSDFSAKLSRLIFSSLVTVDNPEGTLQNDLASSIQVVNPTTIDITMRKDAFWHDGQPVTAQDVHFTFTSLERVKSPFAGTARRIQSIDVLDTHRLRITLKAPHAPFLSDLSLGILPKHAANEDGTFPKDTLIGSGPFQFEARKGDSWISLTSFDKHHNGKPPLHRVIFRVIPDDNARLLAMIGGSGQLMQNAITPLLLPAVQDNPKLTTETAPSIKYTYLAFNMRHETLNNPLVRQAIAHSIDRPSIIQNKFSNHATLSTGLLPPHHPNYNPNVPTYDYNPQRARELLDQAGLPDPDGDGPKPRLKLTYKTTTNQFRRSIAELIRDQLALVGIELQIQAYEWGTFFNDIKSGNFDLCSLQWVSVTEPDLYTWIFHSNSIPSPEKRSSGANRGAYNNPNIDALLDQARVEMDPEKRHTLYLEVQRIIATDLPYVSLWHEDNILVRSFDVHGYTIAPNARFSGLRTTSWDRQPTPTPPQNQPQP